MSGIKHHLWMSVLACGLAVALAGNAAAAPGDLHRVVGAKVNLRSGPSENATVRSTLEQGDELVELRRDHGWLGVRVLRTGEEGWIYGNLVDRVAQSQLQLVPADAGFQTLSPEFDQLIAAMAEQLGYPIIRSVETSTGDTLRVVPTDDFLVNSGRDAHMAVALAIYEMWKNHENQRPVRLEFLGLDGRPYMVVEETAGGPRWSTE